MRRKAVERTLTKIYILFSQNLCNMSEVDTVYTRKYDVFTYLGWTACGVIFITQIFWEFFFGMLDPTVQVQVGNAISTISGIFVVLLMVSYYNYVRQLPDSQAKLVGGLIAVAALIKLIDVFFGINLGVVNFLKNPVLAIPIVILCFLYWNYGLFPKILTGAFSLRILLQLVIGIIGIFTNSPSFLRLFRRYAYLITLLVLAYWFFLGIPDLKKTKSASTSTSTPTTIQPTTTSEREETYIGSGDGIPPSTSGWTHGVPRITFWCEECNKKANFRMKSNADIGNAHPCPSCGTTLKAWWVEPTRESYFKFVGGGFLLFGAMMTVMFETTLGNYGLDPITMLIIISTSEMLIGAFIMYSGTKLTHTGPPAYATTKVSLEPQKQFLKEAIIMVVIMFTGAAIVYGINAGLIAVVFG